MALYDCFTFFNELDLLELRLNELSDVVDIFVIAESTLTFQGNLKPLYFQENRARFAKFDKQIRHIIVDDMPTTQNPWNREHHQRNALKRGLTDAAPDDMVIIADVDEVPNPIAIRELKNRNKLTYLQMRLFVYCLNCEVLEGVDAPTIAPYAAPFSYIKTLQDLTAPRNGSADNYLNLQKMGALSDHLIPDGGWHFSWLGNIDQILQKMGAFSHTEQRYRKWNDPQELEQVISEKRFFLYDCAVQPCPVSDMPITVQKAADFYREKGLLVPDPSPEEQAQAKKQTAISIPPEASRRPLSPPEQTENDVGRCPICSCKSLTPVATKFVVPYLACKDCEAVFADDLQTRPLIIHDDFETRANVEAQNTILQRGVHYLRRRPERMMDFSYGRGAYVDFLTGLGIKAVGVDPTVPSVLMQFPSQSFDIINMVEIIEHLAHPVETLTQLLNLLKPDGVIYIESSFVDFIGDPARSDYVDPRIGHCCIHSRRSISYLCWKLRVRGAWINNNVLVIQKNAVSP